MTEKDIQLLWKHEGEEEWRKLLREQDDGRGSSAHIEKRGAHIRET